MNGLAPDAHGLSQHCRSDPRAGGAATVAIGGDLAKAARHATGVSIDASNQNEPDVNPDTIVAAAGIARWKRDATQRLLWGDDAPAGRIESSNWRRALAAARQAGGAVAVWPSRVPADFEDHAAQAGVPVWRIEDGFIRSVGLGSDCTPPASLVVDRQGMYYDASRASDLETMIEAGGFAPDLLARAEALVARLVRDAVGKYAVGRETAVLPTDGRRRVLVVGQVEDDLSVVKSGCGVAGNLDLLRRARAAEPDAMLIFRPHPDVDQGHRRGAIPDRDALAHVDVVVRDGTMAGLIEAVDGVHVLTSLAGFEALMRDRPVTTHGHPFYAGWGLTRDLAGPVARRTRRATLAELAAATLIAYPRYLDPVTNRLCTPEILVDRFAAPDYRPPLTLAMRARRVQAMVHRGIVRAKVRLGFA